MIKKVAAKTHSFILRKKWKMKSDAGASLLGGCSDRITRNISVKS